MFFAFKKDFSILTIRWTRCFLLSSLVDTIRVDVAAVWKAVVGLEKAKEIETNRNRMLLLFSQLPMIY